MSINVRQYTSVGPLPLGSVMMDDSAPTQDRIKFFKSYKKCAPWKLNCDFWSFQGDLLQNKMIKEMEYCWYLFVRYRFLFMYYQFCVRLYFLAICSIGFILIIYGTVADLRHTAGFASQTGLTFYDMINWEQRERERNTHHKWHKG